MEDVCSLSSNKPEECWLKLGESIRHHAHGCRLYGYRVSYEIIDGYEQSFVPYQAYHSELKYKMPVPSRISYLSTIFHHPKPLYTFSHQVA